MAHGPESELYSYKLLVMLWHWHMTVLIFLFNYRINYRMRKKLNLLLWPTLDNTHVEEGVSFKTFIVIAFCLVSFFLATKAFERTKGSFKTLIVIVFCLLLFWDQRFWEYKTLIMIDFAVWSWFFIYGEIHQIDRSLIFCLLFWS